MEVTSQSDQFGLPEQHRPAAPAPEKIAEQLRPAPLWERPLRVENEQ
jgi:hypothetical protein